MGGIVAGAIFLLTVLSPLTKEGNKPSPPPQSHTSQIQSPTNSPSPTPQQPKTHTVAPGDSLYTIAKDYYGSVNFWTNLWNDNDWIEDPRIINNGMELKIRDQKPGQPEELKAKLAVLYEEITAPTPTPSPQPVQEVAGASTQAPQGIPGSFDDVYRQAGARYQVPWEILYGLHAMETGLRDGAISSGYGTGAQGPLQFMPGTWTSYGVDGNGDGSADINNVVDAIFGAANFLSAHGGVEQGLKSYGGDTQAALNAARSRGYNQ